MHTLRTLVLALSLLVLAAPAFARDLCFTDTFGNVFVIHKAKKLKKPGKTARVEGYAILVGNTWLAPLSGTAVANSDGRVSYGVFIHNLIEGNDQAVGALTTPAGSAPTHYDTDGNGAPNVSDQWSPIDCATVVIPPAP
jgi:hypothetical protein